MCARHVDYHFLNFIQMLTVVRAMENIFDLWMELFLWTVRSYLMYLIVDRNFEFFELL